MFVLCAVRRVMVVCGLMLVTVGAVVPDLLELLELGQLVIDLQAEWKRLR